MAEGVYLYADTETFNAGLEYSMSPRDFFRTGQYAWDDGPVVITTDYDEFVAQVRAAKYVVMHNGISFDLSWLFGTDSLESLQMCLDRKVIDTYVLASLITPAPYSYTNAKGHTVFDAAKPERAMAYLALDNLAHQFGLPGKVGSLQELAKKYNEPKTLVKNLDYGLIPTDDPEFLEYAEGDIIAVRALWNYLRDRLHAQNYDGGYVWREMAIWGLNAQISRNGILVDQQAAQSRIDALAVERDEVMTWLVKEYDFPTEGKSPWASAKGKEVILKVLADYGVTEQTRPDWPRTPTGALKLGGDELIDLTTGTEGERFGRAMATLKGQRSLAQLALDSMHPDGKVHPQITCLQRSGRTSVQRPGLTVWTARGEGAVEKEYFIADPGTKMLEVDFSAADARAVAAISGDPEYAKRFEDGADAHDITGVIFFGEAEYFADRDRLRQIAKIANHSMSYRVGSKKLADSTGVSVGQAKEFLRLYQETYPWVYRWQNQVTEEGDTKGYVTNNWGRRMTVDKDRSFTQSAALIGQSTTRELLFDALLRIVGTDLERVRWIRATVHDAVLLTLPEWEAEDLATEVVEMMTSVFNPGTKLSRATQFPVSRGPLADNWFGAGH